MSELTKCIHCYRKYDLSKSRFCPQCGLSQNASSSRNDSQEESVYQSPKSNNPLLSDDAKAIISEQKRTTAAIRSLAIYFFINLTSSVIGSAIIYLGVLISTIPIIAVGSIVVVVGFILALIAGLNELKRS